MGTGKPKAPKSDLSVEEILACCTGEGPEFDLVSGRYSDLDLLSETDCRRNAKPGLPSNSSRYSPRRLKGDSASTTRENLCQPPEGQYKLIKHLHPEGRPYFQQGQFVTCDDMQDPMIAKIMLQALVLVCFILKQISEVRPDFDFQQGAEFCIELESLTIPPEFNYYIIDHNEHTIIWAEGHRPTEIEQTNEITRGNMLREEYWKHMEYYPCHRFTTVADYEELNQLLAAYATDAATSEGSTSPMSAKEIRSHLKVLKSFGDKQSMHKTWAVARLFGLFIRGQIVNRYGSQNARLDRFASLDIAPPKFRGQYSMINVHMTLGLANRHLRRCSRTWADRIAYTESWRAYKQRYLKEWKEIRYLACAILFACSNLYGRVQSSVTLLLIRAAATLSLMSAVSSYQLSNDLANTGDHAADAATYFQQGEEANYGVQRLSLLNCAPQASLAWSVGFLVLAVLV